MTCLIFHQTLGRQYTEESLLVCSECLFRLNVSVVKMIPQFYSSCENQDRRSMLEHPVALDTGVVQCQ